MMDRVKQGNRWRRALRCTTALALTVVTGFYRFDVFTRGRWASYDAFSDLAIWTMIVAIIATPLTSQLPRAARWAGVGLWFTATLPLTLPSILTRYMASIGDGDVSASLALWIGNGFDVPVTLPVLIVISLMFGAAVSGPPQRSATIDTIFFWKPEPLDSRSGDSGARL